jgi:hypothetical protein
MIEINNKNRYGGTDNARTLIYEPGLGLAQMQKCIEY